MVTVRFPFVFIVIGIMIAWEKGIYVRIRT